MGTVAVLAPTSAFDAVLAGFIGQPGHAATTAAQRMIAVVGTAVGTLATAVIAMRMHAPTLESKPRRGILLVVLGGLLLLNALTLAHRSGALRHVYPPRWSYAAVALAMCLGCAWFLLAPERRNEATQRRVLPLWVATAAGAGYGCFSGLWHCCAALWAGSNWALSLVNILWFAALALSLGAVGRLAASVRVGLGEALGAGIFAITYPWHTFPFFVQNLIGGAFATALVRATGSGWAPALFLGTAYLTHTTLPFVGTTGVVIAGAILLTHVVLAGRWRRAGTVRLQADAIR